MIDKALVEALRNSDSKVLEALYLEHKSAFIGFAKKYPLDDETIIDIYQDAIIALRENAIKGNLDDLKSEVKTYLFSIGKYMIYKVIKEQRKIYLIEETKAFDSLVVNSDFSVDLVEDLTEEQEKLQVGFKGLGEKCKAILTLFYYRGFTIEDITNELNYTNKDVTKSQKSRCIKTLKDLIFKS